MSQKSGEFWPNLDIILAKKWSKSVLNEKKLFVLVQNYLTFWLLVVSWETQNISSPSTPIIDHWFWFTDPWANGVLEKKFNLSAFFTKKKSNFLPLQNDQNLQRRNCRLPTQTWLIQGTFSLTKIQIFIL